MQRYPSKGQQQQQQQWQQQQSSHQCLLNDANNADSITNAEVQTNNEDADGKVQMTPQLLRKVCKTHKGYSTPQLNERLYLHYLGLTTITDAIKPYVGCTVLYLNNNPGITNIQALSPLIHLRSLYLSHNSLSTLTSLPALSQLTLLDVSDNMLHSLEGLHTFQGSLQTLLASHNQLCSLDHQLHGMIKLTTLDLSFNRLHSLHDVLQQLTHVQSTLQSCMLHGNELARSSKHYRKQCIATLPVLCYLDERPIQQDERLCAEAFIRNGVEGEAAARASAAQRRKQQRTQQFTFYEQFRNTARQAQAQNRQTDEEKVITTSTSNNKNAFNSVASSVTLLEYMKRVNDIEHTHHQDDNSDDNNDDVYIPM